MKLVIAEKNIAAQKIAQLLADGKPKTDKVYNTQVYRFTVQGEDWVSMGLAGHILAPDFPDEVLFDKKQGWYSVTEDGEVLPPMYPTGSRARRTTPSASRSLPTASISRAGRSRAYRISRGRPLSKSPRRRRLSVCSKTLQKRPIT